MANLAWWLPRDMEERKTETQVREGEMESQEEEEERERGTIYVRKGSPCLNIILLEVTMHALVCPALLNLITEPVSRTIFHCLQAQGGLLLPN